MFFLAAIDVSYIDDLEALCNKRVRLCLVYMDVVVLLLRSLLEVDLFVLCFVRVYDLVYRLLFGDA